MDISKSKKVLRDHLVDLTKELIHFPSHVNEPLKVFELVSFIKAYFAKCDLNITDHVIEGAPALVITTENTRHPHVLMSGHIDVVPSSNIFTAKVGGDLLHGAGAMDMKSGVACMMAIMKFFSMKKDRPSLGLMLTSDEETGGQGTRVLLQDDGYKADFCIVGEGRQSYDVVIREKGIMVVSVSLKANPVHSAYPWKGHNVLEDLMKICLNVRSHFPRVRDAWIPTVSVTSLTVRSGQEMNTIPGEVDATLFFRLTEKKKWSREKIMELLKGVAPHAEIKELLYGAVFNMDPENSYIKLLKNVATEVTGKRMRFGDNHGASDARFFLDKGIPTAILGPVGRDHHSPNESVLISSVETHFEVLKSFIEDEWKIFRGTAKQFTDVKK